MDEYYSTSTEESRPEKGKTAWLRSFELDQNGEAITIIIEADGLQGNEATVDLYQNKLRIGYLRRNGKQVIGIVTEEFILPQLEGGRLIEHGSNGNVLYISILSRRRKPKREHRFERKQNWDRISQWKSNLNSKEQ